MQGWVHGAGDADEETRRAEHTLRAATVAHMNARRERAQTRKCLNRPLLPIGRSLLPDTLVSFDTHHRLGDLRQVYEQRLCGPRRGIQRQNGGSKFRVSGKQLRGGHGLIGSLFNYIYLSTQHSHQEPMSLSISLPIS